MRTRLRFCQQSLRVLCVGAALWVAGRTVAAVDAPPAAHLGGGLKLPLYFEANRGQMAGDFQFVARSQSRNVLLSAQEACVMLIKGDRDSCDALEGRAVKRRPGEFQSRSVALHFVGANPNTELAGEVELPGRINYFLGNDPAEWRRGVSTWTRVRAKEVYPGIDIVYYGNQERLEYDLIVQPYAHPEDITIRVRGADKLRVDERGDLVIGLGKDEIRQLKPVMYQDIRGERKPVQGAYRLGRDHTVMFQIGEYDRARMLVIDPIFSYVQFIEGNNGDTAWDLAFQTDGTNGYLFVTGETFSTDLGGTTNAFSTNFAGGTTVGGDAFVAKFDANTTDLALVYITYLGGKSHDGAFSLATDNDGNAYLTGYTASTNFPIVGMLRTNLNGGILTTPSFQNVDAFVTKLSASGSNLVYSAFLGGGGVDEGFGIAVDAAGIAYVTGFTESTNFPLANSTYSNTNGSGDVFVTSISSDGQSFGYSLVVGGTGEDHAEAVIADSEGNAYVCGFTRSSGFPVTTNNAYQVLLNQVTNVTSVADAFLLKVSPAGAVTYASFLGGIRDDIAFNLASDAAGAIYVCGSTTSTNFVLTATNIHSGLVSNNISADAFVTKFDATLTNVIYSSVFGGTAKEEAWDMAVDSQGRVHVGGGTFSANFPVTNSASFLDVTNNGGRDVFVAQLNPEGTALNYAGYLGRPGDDAAYAVKLDGAGNTYLAGQVPEGSTSDAFVVKIALEPLLTIARSDTHVLLSWPAFTPEFDIVTSTNLPPSNGWAVVNATPVVSGGQHIVTLPATNDASFFRLQH